MADNSDELVFVYDLETDDLITQKDDVEIYPAILQICIINYITNEVIYNDFVFSDVPIQPFITKINNITNEMIKNAPTIDQTRDNLFNVFKQMKNITVIAHNGIGFDHKIMAYYNLFPSHLKINYLDSKIIIPKLLPNLKSYRLLHIYEYIFGMDITDIHSAEGDSRAVIQILKKLLWSN